MHNKHSRKILYVILSVMAEIDDLYDDFVDLFELVQRLTRHKAT